jgi:hypothetical protein
VFRVAAEDYVRSSKQGASYIVLGRWNFFVVLPYMDIMNIVVSHIIKYQLQKKSII